MRCLVLSCVYVFNCGLYYKRFTIIIYDRNDNGLYYKTTITTCLALARSANYDLRYAAN
jgi:hypothetical protein